MGKELKTIGFAAAVCLACSLLLAAVYSGLKEQQDRNKEIDLKVNVLKTFGVEVLDDKGRWAMAPEEIEEIFAEQVKDKPPNIIDKIIQGKMNKFFAENCLLAQPFVKDDSKSVAQVLAEAAKQAGGEAKIKRFVRFEVG